jgi:hypothetical protein
MEGVVRMSWAGCSHSGTLLHPDWAASFLSPPLVLFARAGSLLLVALTYRPPRAKMLPGLSPPSPSLRVWSPVYVARQQDANIYVELANSRD